MNVSSYTISIDEKGTLNITSFDRKIAMQIRIQQVDALNGDDINPSVNNDPSTTAPRNDLQQRIRANTEYVVDRVVTLIQTPIGTQCRVQ